MAETNRQHREIETSVGYAATGHPSVDELMAEQGTAIFGPQRSPSRIFWASSMSGAATSVPTSVFERFLWKQEARIMAALDWS
jgi:hypothetical protein